MGCPIPLESEIALGGMGLCSTAGDYVRLVQAVVRALAGVEEGSITKETAELMVALQLNKQQREG